VPVEAVREVLAAYGVAAAASVTAADVDAAVAAARAVGYPVAIKLASATITHKSDVGGVVLDVDDDDGVRAAWAGMGDALDGLGRRAEMDGVVVQPMIPRGVETFVGATRGAGFPPLIGFGTGGTAVELWKDVVFRLHPLTDLDAAEMLDGIRGRALLDGFRGAPAADRAALVDALLRIDRLVGDVPEIVELDLNPLVARPPGGGVIVVDARIRVEA
ncbi:MAG: acetate--CoA ligase family protein, partial [Myxococcales bacterium]|nr:acetate--CoA ligase family protein [Myxococcales bacterium]